MKFLKNTNWIYLIMSVLIVLVVASCGSTVFGQNLDRSISNLFIILLIIPITIISSFFKKKIIINEKKYKIILCIFFLIVIGIQIFYIKSLFFLTGWDVGELRNISDTFIINKEIGINSYLTHYPNNMLLTFILIVVKSIPLLGKHAMFVSFVGTLQIDLASLFTILLIKRFINNKYSIISLIVILPLVLLSPWLLIPYSDSYAILYPILIIYIYTKKSKKSFDWFLISALSFWGYYIKPTVLIVLIAILIVVLFDFFENLKTNKWLNKNTISSLLCFVIGFIGVFCFNKILPILLRFEPNSSDKEINVIHYLAMGQNNETNGIFSPEDYGETLENDDQFNINKFKLRISERGLINNLVFFKNKLLINYNDGSFSWTGEGQFFYQLYETQNKIYIFMRNIFYKGKYYHIYLDIVQIAWLFILMCCPFAIYNKNKKEKYVLFLSQIGITLFLLIFEARARYLFCFSPIIIINGFIGYSEIRNKCNQYTLGG